MKNFATKLAAIAATTVFSFSAYAFADCEAIQIGMGYRQDSVRWKIDDVHFVNPSADVNFHFRDMEIFLLGGKVKSMFGCNSYGRLSFDYGWVLDGRLRQKADIYDVSSVSHARNGKLTAEGEFASILEKDKEKGDSYVWDLNIAVGSPMDCGCTDFQFSPMIGFSYDRQHFNFHNHHKIRVHGGGCGSFDVSFESLHSSCSSSSSSEEAAAIDENTVVVVQESSSSSSRKKRSGSFQTSYWGPWIGFDVFYNCQSCWNMFGEFELHFGRCERKTSSNIGINFVRGYKRTKNFWGPTFKIGGNYNFCDCWYMEAAFTYLYWMSYGCHDHLYLSSGSIRFDVGYLF